VCCLSYTTPSGPNRNTVRPIVEVSHSWLPCNHVLLLESSMCPWKRLICGCLVTMSFDPTRHNTIISPSNSRVVCAHCIQTLLFVFSISYQAPSVAVLDGLHPDLQYPPRPVTSSYVSRSVWPRTAHSLGGPISINIYDTPCSCSNCGCRSVRRHRREYCRALKRVGSLSKLRRSYYRTARLVLAATECVLSE
jgi:hypothetical protein